MIREIKITPALNGFICKVGCQTVVFTSISGLITALDAYLNNPDMTEKNYIKNAVNKMPDCIEPTAECLNAVSCTAVDTAPARQR